MRQWSRAQIRGGDEAPSFEGDVGATSMVTHPWERPRSRIRSVIAASISAPRAARPAGAATSRTRSVPRLCSRAEGSDASQTEPRFATVAPLASRIAARISGSSLRVSLRIAIVQSIEKSPVQLLDRVVALPAHRERDAELPALALHVALATRVRPDVEDRVLERSRLGVRSEHHVQVANHRPEQIDLLVDDLQYVGL